MLFSRSIRRKMMFGLALILAMLLTLYFSAVSGLKSYRELKDELRFSMTAAPLQADLVKATSKLLAPLAMDGPEGGEEAAIGAVPAAQLPNSPGNCSRGDPHLPGEAAQLASHRSRAKARPSDGGISRRLGRKIDESRRITVPAGRPREAQGCCTRDAAAHIEVHEHAQEVPNFQEALVKTLNEADDVYRSRLLLVRWAAVFVVLLFCLLLWYGYSGVFAPLRTLHQGAQRVGQGDFEYRVDINTNDEVAELAAAFNRMTARFQEITRNLDREVRERSKQLVRSDRLANLGRFAAGIAHEINNPLTSIAAAAEALEYRQQESDLARKDASVGNGGRRGLRLRRRMPMTTAELHENTCRSFKKKRFAARELPAEYSIFRADRIRLAPSATSR